MNRTFTQQDAAGPKVGLKKQLFPKMSSTPSRMVKKACPVELEASDCSKTSQKWNGACVNVHISSTEGNTVEGGNEWEKLARKCFHCPLCTRMCVTTPGKGGSYRIVRIPRESDRRRYIWLPALENVRANECTLRDSSVWFFFGFVDYCSRIVAMAIQQSKTVLLMDEKVETLVIHI